MANTVAPTEVNIDGSSTGGSLDFNNLLPQILLKFVAVLEGAIIIAIGVLLIRYVRKYLQKFETTHEQQRTAINLLEKITSGFLMVISVTVALKVVGIDITLLVSVGILGLSYGLQDIIKNYVAGILILFKSPFRIGETVKIRNHTGKVHKIDFQSTTLETFDQRHITIYNSDVMTQSIINFSNNTIRRVDISVMLGYGSDAVKAISIFEKILQNNGAVLKNPKYSIIFKKFTDASMEFCLKFWVQKPCNILKIKSQIGVQISQAFDEEKIYMPYIKGIEAESDFTLNDGRKNRIQVFYNQPMLAEATAAEGINAETGEELDAEEPE